MSASTADRSAVVSRKLLRQTPYHSERLWALVRATPDGKTEMCYLLQPTRKDLWQATINEEWLGTGHTKESLQRAGWVATRVQVEEIGT